MRYVCFLLFAAITPLFSCTRSDVRGEDRVVVLSVAESGVSKTDALAAGDKVAVFARIDGTEHYFLEAAKYAVGEDEHSLTYGSTVYYPETEQVVNFYAYVPYHTGTFSVPSDQSPATELKQADLCWATASSTPISIVPLTFQHLFARLIVQTNEPTEQIACTVAPSGTLNPATGVFTLNSTKSEVYTRGNELILPAQPLTRLVLAVSGVDYVFEGPIALLPGQTTSLSLTLNPTTKTATLDGSSTTDWSLATGKGDSNSPINNQLKLHWVAPNAAYASATKITLTLENPTTKATQTIDVVPSLVAAESSAAACTYSLPVALAANSGLWYPYTVANAKIYQGPTLLHEATPEAMKGTTVYRSGSQTMAINRYIQVRDAATNTVDIKEWLNVDQDFGSMLVKVTTVGCDNWTAVVEGGDGVNVQPSSGTSGQVVRLNWSPNLTSSAKTGRVVKFYPIGDPTAYTPINTTQNAGPTSKAVLINGVYWATGNLIADGANGCKIGAPTDCGLYFQFGSLIGWKGSVNGTGAGAPSRTPPLVGGKNAVTMPLCCKYTSDIWPNGAVNTNTLSLPYFNYAGTHNGINYETKQSNINLFDKPVVGEDNTKPNLQAGRYAPLGIGDPCSYYLGIQWRQPTNTEAANLINATWSYKETPAKGFWFGPNSNVASPSVSSNVFLVGSGVWLDNIIGYSLWPDERPGAPHCNTHTSFTGANNVSCFDLRANSFIEMRVSDVSEYPAYGLQYRPTGMPARCVTIL